MTTDPADPPPLAEFLLARDEPSTSDRPPGGTSPFGQSIHRATPLDVYCLSCGYNLRGQSGDPRRCPECGHLNPMGEVTIPAELIALQLREMETSPAFCLLFLMLFVFLGSVALWAAIGLPRHMSDRGFFMACSLALIVPTAVFWFASCWMFRRSCLGKAGWAGALLNYHTFGLATVVVAFSPIFGVAIVFWGGVSLPELNAPAAKVASAIGGLLLILFVLVAMMRGVAYCYRRAVKHMHLLQREVAVSVAREALRRTLARQRRVGFL